MKLFFVSTISAIVGVIAGLLLKASIQKDPKLDLSYPVLLVDSSDISVTSEKNRIHSIPIDIPGLTAESAILRIGIFHSADDTGDKGMTYQITGKEGQVLSAGSKASKDWDWVELKVKSRDRISLVVKDEDTAFSGASPGNMAALQIQLRSK